MIMLRRSGKYSLDFIFDETGAEAIAACALGAADGNSGRWSILVQKGTFPHRRWRRNNRECELCIYEDDLVSTVTFYESEVCLRVPTDTVEYLKTICTDLVSLGKHFSGELCYVTMADLEMTIYAQTHTA